jgi:hypothetical protein
MIVIKSKQMIWVGHVADLEVIRNVYKILVGKYEEKSPSEKRRHRWVDKIKKYLKRDRPCGCGLNSAKSE